MSESTAQTVKSQPAAEPKAALITGAAVRLGREIALAMAKDGWDIGIHYKQSREAALGLAQEIQALGRSSVLVCADLHQPAQVADAFAQAVAGLPHLNCVVNNASAFEFDRPESTRPEQLAAHYQANLIAPVMLTQLLYQQLKPRYDRGQDPIGASPM